MTALKFAKKVAGNTAFSIADVLLTKCVTIIAFVLLVRLLPNEAIGAIGVATGYVVLITYLDIQPIRVLLRDYPGLSVDTFARDELLTALFGFWCLQVIAMIVVAASLSVWVIAPLAIPGLTFVYIALALDFVALSLQGWIKLIYYVNLQQRTATRLSLIIAICRICAYGVLLYWPSLNTYSWILILSAFCTGAVWCVAFTRRFKFRPKWTGKLTSLIRRTLADYGLWEHLNRTVVNTFFTFHLVILSWFAGISEMGNYTVALRFASLLTLVPAQLNAALQVAGANYSESDHRYMAIQAILKINGLLSMMQFLVIILFGEQIMAILFGDEVAKASFIYALVISLGITLFNLGYPLIGIINNYCKIEKSFKYVYLPALLVGLVAYFGAAANFGAIGVAWGNVVAFGVLAVGISLFVARHYPIPLTAKLVTREEASFLRRLLRG